jgi:hypothetical protein
VVNSDLTTHRATIKERNTWVDRLVAMATRRTPGEVACQAGGSGESSSFGLRKRRRQPLTTDL